MAPTARERGEARVREFLSPADQDRPGKKLKESSLVDLETGRLGLLPVSWQDLSRRGGWFPPLEQDPAYDANATWEAYLLYAQKFYIHHPLVSIRGLHQ